MADCKHIDALMVDWLYDELDSSERAQFDQHVDGCARCQGEIGAFARTREAVRVLPDEDPPPALSAILLHEAAKRAPVAAGDGRPGVFARLIEWLQPVLAHPAAAAVATVVVVVGVAGTLYLSGESLESASTVETASILEEPPPNAAASLPASAKESNKAKDYRVQALDEKERQQYGVVDTRQPELLTLDESVAREAKPKKREERPLRPKKQRRKQPVATAETTAGALLDQEEIGQFRAGLLEGDGTVRARSSAPASARDDGAAPPVAEPAAPPTDQAKRKPGKGKTRADRKADKAGGSAWAQAREQEMLKAVRAKDCRTAARIASDIFERDRNFYYRRIQNAPALNPCRSYFEREQRRRARRRSKAKSQDAPDFDDDIAAEAVSE